MSTVLKSARDQQEETNIGLANSTDSGRPGRDELVPSRYALKVGEIDVLVVSDGVLTLPGAMLGHNVSPAVPVRLPCGGRRRRLSLCTGRLGVLTAC